MSATSVHESRAVSHWRPASTDRTVAVVPGTMPTRPREGQRPQASDEEAWLARRAAAGDGAAFTTLYDRYERRAYNLCYRITGSHDDAADATQETFVKVLERLPHLTGRELQFGPYLLRAARHASYDAIERRRRAAPSAELPDSAVPVGAADSDDLPGRGALLEAHQEQIRAANETLPPRQREALALRELEELSYDEIAEIMGMNRNSVAQLISRARIGLRDGLRRTALGSIASASPDCERALPLLALRQDGALGSNADWLARHLSACAICPARVAAMEEAGVAYRLWLPVVPALWLRDAAIAHAAERVGADWSDSAAPAGSGPPRFRRARRRGASGAAVVLVLVTAALVAAEASRAPERPAPVAAYERASSAALPTPTAVTRDAPETAVVRRPEATPQRASHARLVRARPAAHRPIAPPRPRAQGRQRSHPGPGRDPSQPGCRAALRARIRPLSFPARIPSTTTLPASARRRTTRPSRPRHATSGLVPMGARIAHARPTRDRRPSRIGATVRPGPRPHVPPTRRAPARLPAGSTCPQPPPGRGPDGGRSE